MFQVDMYTDGSCSGNGTETAVGGWCAILRYNGVEKEYHGWESHTTNNRMELRAVIEGVRQLKHPCHVTVYTDSQYVVTSAYSMKKWLKSNKPHANMDMWYELIRVGRDGQHKIQFQHAKGHAGDPMNERCDKIARSEATKSTKNRKEN